MAWNKKVKTKNAIANLLKASVAISSALFLAACGDSGSTDTPKGPDMSVAAMEDLPNCTENREGMTALVAEDNATYECKSGKWTFVSAPMQTVETLDDLSNCTSKVEGDTVKVASESAIFRCDDGKWEKYRTLTDTLESADDLLACVAKREGNTSYITREHALYRCVDGSWEKMVAFMDTVKTKDDLPNCTGKKEGDSTFVSKDESVYLCIDKEWAYLGEVTDESDDLPNCTEKREGNKAFVAAEHETLICSDGKWLLYDIYKEMEEKDSPESSSGSVKSSNSQKEESSSSISNKSSSSQKIESSSSKDSKPIGGKYDCSVYKCVTTEYLNQEMLAAGKYGELLDVRDSQVYRTIKIGTQTWMAQDLNYSDGDSREGMYGQLYPTLENKCPDGWHAPDPLEWHEMLSYVYDNNGGEPLGISLKATSGWIPEGEMKTVLGDSVESDDSIRVGTSTGTDRFGFGALPSGSCWGDECYRGDDARYWVKAELIFKLAFDKNELFIERTAAYPYISVRCIQDEESLGNISSSSMTMAGSSSSALSQFNPDIEYGKMTDSRDNRTYRTVTIGLQTWMAENLNFEAESSFCYNNEENNCTRYGRLYTWAAAVGKSESECGNKKCSLPSGDIQGVCPSGWHLPSKTEWETLFNAVGERSTAGKVLKSASGWIVVGNGSDAFGFSALPAGARGSNGDFGGVVYNAYFWSSIEKSNRDAYYIELNYIDAASVNSFAYDYKTSGRSVRCLQD